ncbi:hypothetical protein [Pseudobdellovibrio sp. HCB154]|uniref:hypothetical protein n=1 Tax=Pseudobdellovibrio sp. HCB154 TaxID=3386277 RepID=UPI00391704A6
MFALLNKKLILVLVCADLLLMPTFLMASEAAEDAKSINFDKILNPAYKKAKFRITTATKKEDVHLEFEAFKLSGGSYSVYKTNSCDLKNFSAAKLKKLNANDLFFSFTTKSGNIFEERKIDFRTSSKFNLGIFSFALIKNGNPKTAIICFSQ